MSSSKEITENILTKSLEAVTEPNYKVSIRRLDASFGAKQALKNIKFDVK